MLLSILDADAQWLAGYTHRIKITIDNTKVSGTANHNNFPVLINLTENDLRTTGNGGGMVNLNGWDTKFTESDGTTTLDHEIEKYNSITGEYVAWVRIPSLSPTVDTDIYLYYGNSSIGTDPSTTAVWNSDYMGVWHLHDDFLDATSNDIDGTNNGSSNTIGKIADGQSFTPSYNPSDHDYIDLGNPAILNFSTGEWTLSAWTNTIATGQRNIISNGGDDAGGIRYVMAFGENGLHGQAVITTDDNSTPPPPAKYQAQDILPSNDGVWHYITAVRDADTLRIYVDGSEKDTIHILRTPYDLSGTSQQNAYIGIGYSQAGDTLTKPFDGLIDEARISDIARSGDWILTEFNNQNNPSGFYSTTSTEAITRYAIKSGDWNDPTAWSYFSGGASCGCIPDANSEVHVNEAAGGYIINLNVDANVKDLTIYNGGTLQWSADNLELQINNAGTVTVESGGTLNENSKNGAKIFLVTDDSSYVFDNEGSFIIDDVELYNYGGSLNITGSSDITVTNNFKFVDNKITVTNNHTGTLDIQRDLILTGDTSAFTNNGIIDIGNNLRLDGVGCDFSNSGPLNVTKDLNLKGNNSILTNNDTINVLNRIQFQESNCTVVNNGIIDVTSNLRAGADKTGNVFTNNASGTTTFGGDFSFRNTDVTINNYGIFNLDGVQHMTRMFSCIVIMMPIHLTIMVPGHRT